MFCVFCVILILFIVISKDVWMFGYLILFFCFLRCFPKLLFRFLTTEQMSSRPESIFIQISGRPESFLITDTDLGFAGFFFTEKQFLTFLELIL